MSKIHIFITEQYRERALKAAGGPQKVSRWLDETVLPAFFNPSGIEELRQENTRLKGEVAGLRYALSILRPAGMHVHEGSENGQQYNPYPPGDGQQ
jgi:hypothetical protein